jgi:hypothetical protein
MALYNVDEIEQFKGIVLEEIANESPETRGFRFADLENELQPPLAEMRKRNLRRSPESRTQIQSLGHSRYWKTHLGSHS